jgi:hypothetical protein
MLPIYPDVAPNRGAVGGTDDPSGELEPTAGLLFALAYNVIIKMNAREDKEVY